MNKAKIIKGPNGFYWENFYTPLPEAKREIWRRWNDQSLRREVENFLRGDIPKPLRKIPRAVLSVYVATPDLYTFRFLELAKESLLTPICLEYTHDKFYGGNHCKYYMGKLFFWKGKGKHGGNKVSDLTIINFNKAQSKRLSDVDTIWGENFIHFHHRILQSFTNNCKIETYDWSDWLIRMLSPYYYYLALFIIYGILFDNYLLDEREKDFCENIVLPNFNKVNDYFVLNPIIVPIIPFEEEKEIYWNCYQEFVRLPVVESLRK